MRVYTILMRVLHPDRAPIAARCLARMRFVGVHPHQFWRAGPPSRENYAHNAQAALAYFALHEMAPYLLYLEDDAYLSLAFPRILQQLLVADYWATALYVTGVALYPAAIRRAITRGQGIVEGPYPLRRAPYYGSVALLLRRDAVQTLLRLPWRTLCHPGRLEQVDIMLRRAAGAAQQPIMAWLPNPVRHDGVRSTMTSKSHLQSAYLAEDLR